MKREKLKKEQSERGKLDESMLDARYLEGLLQSDERMFKRLKYLKYFYYLFIVAILAIFSIFIYNGVMTYTETILQVPLN